MAGRLEGKVALVTGAGSSGPGWGNGKAAAILYAREGARVACLDARAGAAEETRGLIEAQRGTAIALAADVTDEREVASAVAACVEAFGRLDVLHNNVGIARLGGPIETPEEDWDRVVAVNQTSMFLTMKHALPVMERQRAGAIVNISSIAALRWLGFPYAAYTATKAAVIGMTKNVAYQYAGRGIRANCVLPGLMDTPMIREPLKDAYGGDVDRMIDQRNAQCPMGFMGNAWDVAHASLFLASDEARYVTGIELVVDGGLTLGCV